MDDVEILKRLAIACAIGVLIGLERGWRSRDEPEGRAVAGIRTFALLSLLGAAAGLIYGDIGALPLAAGFVAVAVVLVVLRVRALPTTGDLGATTVIAGLLAYALGAAAMFGELAFAVAAGVVATLLLGIKTELHAAIRRLDRDELLAVLKLLVMSFALLPVLPDRGFGPWQALNPRDIWLMVVLICAVSFVGYVGVRHFGARRGTLFAALAGALVSSTAVTIGLSRRPENVRLAGAGIVLASSVMLLRSLAVVSVINRELSLALLPAIAAAVLAGLAVALVLLRRADRGTKAAIELKNPFEFWVAVQFGALLAAVTVAAAAARAWIGDAGVLALAGLSGLLDVDAVTLTIGRTSLDLTTARDAVLLAIVANTVLKAAIALYNSRGSLAAPVLIGLGGQLVALAVVTLVAVVH